MFVISGPSGVGKDALIEKLVALDPNLERSVSYTTRRPRPNEKDGVDYSFVSREAFQGLVERGEFLESATYDGNMYGTSARRVEDLQSAGHDVILKIDVKGAEQVRRRLPDATLIFLAPPSMDELERRLRGRRTEDEGRIARRLATAAWEMNQTDWFDHVVVNDDLGRASSQVAAIIEASRSKT